MRKTASNILILISILTGLIQAQDKTIINIETAQKKLPFGLTTNQYIHTPKIVLTLSGGGSRSLSQIGVLQAFEENKIPINLIVGTSMGSIIGGLYSAGYSIDQLIEIGKNSKWEEFGSATEQNRNDLFVDQKITEDKAFLTLRLEGLKPVIPNSINSGIKISQFLNSLAINAPLNSEENFSELFVDFKAVCTDLVKGLPFVYSSGSLVNAMRASSSVSLLLPPVKMDSLLLADGGLVANIPVNISKKYDTDLIIAVNTTSPLHTYEELQYPWHVADQIVSIPITAINQLNLSSADIVVEPNMGKQDGSDFKNIDKLINDGYSAGLNVVNSIRKRIDSLYLRNFNLNILEFKSVLFTSNLVEIENKLIEKFQYKQKLTISDVYKYSIELQNSGYYKNISIEIKSDISGKKIHLNADKNDIINNVKINGITNLNKHKFQKLFELEGSVYNARKISSLLLKILQSYRGSSNSLAKILSVNFEGNKLTVSIDEGRIGLITVTGLKQTDKTIIYRELPFNEGDIFSKELASMGLANLQSTDLFKNIELRLKREKGINEIEIIVEEKIASVARFGLRIDNEYKTQISLDIRNENVFGTGTELGAIFTSGLHNRDITIEHKANRIFNTYLTYKFRTYHSFRDIKIYGQKTNATNKLERIEVAKYRKKTTGISFGVGTQIQKFGNLIFESRYENIKLENKTNFENQESDRNIFTFRTALTVDSKNKYPFPTKGMTLKLFYETAQKLFGTELGYFKFNLDYHSYFQLADNHNFNTRVKLGFADLTLPLGNQFRLGGQASFFGYRDYEYMGRQIFISSAEYRYKLPFKIITDVYFKLRYDLGSIWSEKEAIRFKDLRHGLGATLAINTPLGPANFSVGKSFLIDNNLENPKIKYGPTYFYFTIGYYY